MNPQPSFLRTDFDPLFVTSPTIRSGTTLLQRLLCSSPRALIYGEMCGLDLKLTLNLYASRVLLLTQNKDRYHETMRQVLEGQVNDWILDLTPDVEEYLAAVGRSSLSWLGFCRDYACKVGRPVWGIKYPAMTPALLQLIRHVMPASRLLYIHRDVMDCVKSAKATHGAWSTEEAKELCQTWVANLRYVLGLGKDPGLLVVSFADLLAEPVETLERIAAFSGAVDMDRKVLDHKINTFAAGTGQEKKSYFAPADLTDQEKQIVAEVTSALREQLYDVV
jgi:hypothetical protein